MKRLNDKGLSLVELLVSVAVFSIVMVAMFTMLTTATKSYNKNRAEAQAQNEAQSLMAQLENIIQDATQGVYVKVGDVFAPYNKMVVCYDDYFSMLWWDGTDVYFFKFDGSLDSSLKADSDYASASDGSSKLTYAILEVYTMLQTNKINDYRTDERNKFILAENVESISIVPNNTYSYVSVSFVINVDGSKYTAKKNIEIRNSSEKRASTSPSSGGSSSGGSSSGSGDSGSGSGSGDSGSGSGDSGSGSGDSGSGSGSGDSGSGSSDSGSGSGDSGSGAGSGDSGSGSSSGDSGSGLGDSGSGSGDSGSGSGTSGVKTKTYTKTVSQTNTSAAYLGTYEFKTWSGDSPDEYSIVVSVSDPVSDTVTCTVKVTGPDRAWNGQVILDWRYTWGTGKEYVDGIN